jgi:hypothetical protein
MASVKYRLGVLNAVAAAILGGQQRMIGLNQHRFQDQAAVGAIGDAEAAGAPDRVRAARLSQGRQPPPAGGGLRLASVVGPVVALACMNFAPTIPHL